MNEPNAEAKAGAPPRALILIAAPLEAQILFGGAPAVPGLQICIAGVGRDGDRAAADAIEGTTAPAVLNVGFAGSVNDRHRAGERFVVTRWVRPAHEAAAPQSACELATGLGAAEASAASVDAPLHDPESRAALAAAGAELVEMEGAYWARLAAARQLPFASLRVVSDGADNPLPLPRHHILTATGGVRWGRWLRASIGSSESMAGNYARLRRAQSDWKAAIQSLRQVGVALEMFARP